MTEPMSDKVRAIDVAWPQDIWRGWVRELQVDNAAMREIVRQVASGQMIVSSNSFLLACGFCKHGVYSLDDAIRHASDCIVPRARALVAQWDTPEGEDRR